MDIHILFLQAHRGFAYLILLLVAVFVIALLASLLGNSGKINNLLKKSTLFTMIFFHIQFLIGIVMLFLTSGFLNTIDQIGMGGLMKNGDLRFSYIEHPFSMLLAAILMTVVNRKVKSSEKVTTGILVLAVLALLLFFYAFPFGKLFGA